MTGKEDIISDGKTTVLVNSGHELLGMVSGTGCMVSSVTGCCASVTDDMLMAAVAALTVFTTAGELAAKNSLGPGTFKQNLMDALQNLTRQELVIRGSAKDITKV